MKHKGDPAEIEVEWDEAKNRANQKAHRVSFAEAATIFSDSLELTIATPTIRFLNIASSRLAYLQRGGC